MYQIVIDCKAYYFMKRFISFSGGVESTTMCVLYGKGATAIFSDAGAENKEMYERLDYCEKRLKEIHDGDFELVRIKPNVKVKGIFVDNLTDAIIGWSFMPTKQMRWCTGKFKIIPIDNYLSQFEQCELMIGLNADEEKREGNWGLLSNVNYRYPLQDDGLNRDDCKVILAEHGLLPNFPIFMQRGGCKYCIFKSLSEWKALYIFDKATFYECKDLEIKVQDKRQKFFAISMTKKSLQQIEDDVNNEIALWGYDAVVDMYKTVTVSEPCGAFCHR
jgi:hypothetical protein